MIYFFMYGNMQKKTAFNNSNVCFFQNGFDPILQEGSRPKVRWLLVAFPESPCKVIHPKYYKHLKKGAHQSHLGRQKMGWFLAD